MISKPIKETKTKMARKKKRVKIELEIPKDIYKNAVDLEKFIDDVTDDLLKRITGSIEIEFRITPEKVLEVLYRLKTRRPSQST